MTSRSMPIRTALLMFLLLMTGCAVAPVTLLPLALPAVISGAGAGITYTFTNVAVKTMTYPLDDVEAANLKALEKMAIEVRKVRHRKHTTRIKSKTRKLTIYIIIERMTPTLTRIKVNAKKNFLMKDRTTAFEVIYQTERFLIGLEEPGAATEKLALAP